MSQKGKNYIILPVIISVIFILSSCNNSPILPGKITVNGRVISQYGSTIQGAKVEINGKTATTSLDGFFSISEVETPYDLKVTGSGLAFVQYGLYTSNPVVASILFSSTQAFNRGNIIIKYPNHLPSGQKVFIYMSPKDGKYPATIDTFNETDSSYSAELRWNDGPVYEFDLYWLTYTHDSGKVLTYEKFYHTTGLQVHNIATETINIPAGQVTNPGETSYTTNAIIPGGYSLQGVDAYMLFGNGSFSGTANFIAFSYNAPVTYTVPTGISVLPKLYASAYAGTGQNSIGKTQLVGSSSTIDLRNGVELLTPPDNQFNVNYSTQFSWSAGEGSGVYEFVVYSPTGQLNLTCITKNTSITLPDLSSMGVNFNSTSDYWWYVRKINGYNSTDEYSKDPYQLKATGQFLAYGRKFNFVNN